MQIELQNYQNKMNLEKLFQDMQKILWKVYKDLGRHETYLKELIQDNSTFINESGLFKLLMKSKLDIADYFPADYYSRLGY